MYLQVLESWKKGLGETHPDALGTQGQLAYTYRRQGRNDEAINLMERVVELYSQTRGVEHPDTKLKARELKLWSDPKWNEEYEELLRWNEQYEESLRKSNEEQQ